MTSMALKDSENQGFMLLLMVATTLLLLVLSLLQTKKIRARNLKLPPSPPKLPIIGNLHQLGSLPHQSLHQLANKFGPIIYLQLGQIPAAVISSARLAMEALKTNDLALANRPKLLSAKHLLYNFTDLAFCPYGAYWKHVRKICILELLSAKRVQFNSFVREEEVAHLVRRVAESYPNTTNLTRMLGLYSNSVVCRAVFGRDFTEGGDCDGHGFQFQKLLEEFQELLGGFNLGEYYPSMEFVSTLCGVESRLKHTSRGFDQFFNELIMEHQNPEYKRNKKDLVDVLLEIQQSGDAELPLTMENIKAIILDMFAGGTDTSFITLDWAMTELVINRKALERAQAEVRSIVRERKLVSENDLPDLHYTRAVIKETLRLHPPAPLLVPRESRENITIDGYEIPAKTRFYINGWAIGRDPNSWENPGMFLPERFINSNIDFKGQDFNFIPFGSGRRICPGMAFATAMVELPLAQLLHSFDWELPPGIEANDLDMTEVFGITTYRKSPLIVAAKPCFPETLN